ncbi:hypothetical protein XENTR_v10017920 [Xenopus tropicalis]|nr:hypothetical protein XENTR_v10017920 [Xenopus tropicalis]
MGLCVLITATQVSLFSCCLIIVQPLRPPNACICPENDVNCSRCKTGLGQGGLLCTVVCKGFKTELKVYLCVSCTLNNISMSWVNTSVCCTLVIGHTG